MTTRAAYSGMVTEKFMLDDLRIEDMLAEFIGKRVKITIEELQLGTAVDDGHTNSNAYLRLMDSE